MTRAIDVPGAGPVAREGLADLLLKFKLPSADTEAEALYRKAAVGETAPVDRIRIGLKLADFYHSRGSDLHAQAELENLRDLFPDDAKRYGVADTLVPTSQPSATPAPPPARNGPPRLPQLPRLAKPTPASP
ncbi:MAG: hypothetical protein WDO13_18570 [Verrucomicrobiota bacterium]